MNSNDLYVSHWYTYSYAYNQAGRVTTQTAGVQLATVGLSIQPLSPSIASFTANYQWDDEGRMTSMSPSLSLPTSNPNSSSFPAMGYQYDANGRLSTLTSNGSNFATASYTPAGQLYQLSYGGLTETDTYNNMLQLISQYVPNYMNMNYNYSPTQNNGRITSSMDYATGENTSYTYDALNRLVGASNSLWSGTYTYDGFGNLLSKSGSGGSPNSFPKMTASYNANNQLTSYNANNQPTTASYDGNGNTMSFNGYSYGYTVENKRNSQTASAFPYALTLYGNDPWGKRVMKETNPDPYGYEGDWNPLWEFYFYTINGQKLVTIDCNNPNANYQPNCWVVGENVYFKKKLLVSNGVYVATDRLGTVRGNTQGEGFEFYPFGEERTNKPDGRDKFATYFRDGVGQDYAEQRYYNAGMGRFWTVDPGRLKTANPSHPSSWNRYAYVEGDPVNFADPHGAYLVDAGGGLLLDCGYGAESIYDGTCTGTDGGWGDDGGGGGGGGGCGGYADGFDLLGEPTPPDPGCPVQPQQPTKSTAQPIQCDITLMSIGAHTWLTMGTYDPNNGTSSSTTIEAGPTPKDGRNFSITGILLGRDWLNALNYGTSTGKEVYNFDQEYTNQQLCLDEAALKVAEAAYKPDTVTYNLLGPNSNTFTAYMLQQAYMSLPTSVSLGLVTSAPGWFSAMPPNP
jgi:RHS repeat-associated protein